MYQNVAKWALTFALGALGGVIQCASDTQPQHGIDFLRHALIGMGPAVAALNITLSNSKDKQP